MRMFNPPHPGSVLKEYLGDIPVTTAARHLHITRAALSRILNGSAGISAEMSLRLADALGTSPELWMGMQAQHDLWGRGERAPHETAPAARGLAGARHSLTPSPAALPPSPRPSPIRPRVESRVCRTT